MNDIIKLSELVSREAKAVPCECGGYADIVKTTNKEDKEFGCGRPWHCCSRAFVCRICKRRIVGSAEAPEFN